MKQPKDTHPFSKLSKPAQRALANAGINSLEDLANLTQKEFMQLHGVGPKSLPILQAAMDEKQLSFAG